LNCFFEVKILQFDNRKLAESLKVNAGVCGIFATKKLNLSSICEFELRSGGQKTAMKLTFVKKEIVKTKVISLTKRHRQY
jgi:hypothetical protein